MNIMSLIKEHRYESVCVALAVLLLLALWPALNLSTKAKAKAVQVGKLANTLAGLQTRSPDGVANESSVKVRNQLAEQAKTEAQDVATLFKRTNQRQFLTPDLFPQVRDPFGFREQYDKEIKDLHDRILKAGWPQEQASGSERRAPEDIGMYIDLDYFGIPEWVGESGAPDSSDCWFGQVAFWIQQDLVQLFSELNHAAADRMGQQPNVTNATVKRVVYIEIDDSYYVENLKTQDPFGVPGPGGGPAGPMGRLPMMMGPRGGFGSMGMPGLSYGVGPEQPKRRRRRKSLAKAFTGHTSNDQRDVLHFSFSVIIDSGRINEFLDLFSRKNLYTILSVSLSREDVEVDTREFKSFDKSDNFNPANDADDDLVYGTAPVIRLDIDAELILLREFYDENMPEQVKEDVKEKISKAAKQMLTEKSARSKKGKRAKRRPKKRKSKK